MRLTIFRRPASIVLFVLLLVMSGCSSVRLISDYDEITDQSVTALQEKVATLFVKLDDEVPSPAADYKNYQVFYQDIKVDLNTLKVRADAIDKNDIVQKQVALLTTMVGDLEKLHKIGFVSKEQVQPLKQPFNSAFTAIIKLQLGLKRGEK